MRPEQEPKYDVDKATGRLVNRASGEEIPDDEPVFIFRARDAHAAEAMRFYRNNCRDPDHRKIVSRRIEDFANFSIHHPDRMKEPDSP